MKSALVLLVAMLGLAGLVALSCTAPLAGAPCECLAGYECDSVANVCRPIGDGDGSPFGPADGGGRSDAGRLIDSSLFPADASLADAADGLADSGGGSADASEADASFVGPGLE